MRKKKDGGEATRTRDGATKEDVATNEIFRVELNEERRENAVNETEREKTDVTRDTQKRAASHQREKRRVARERGAYSHTRRVLAHEVRARTRGACSHRMRVCAWKGATDVIAVARDDAGPARPPSARSLM